MLKKQSKPRNKRNTAQSIDDIAPTPVGATQSSSLSNSTTGRKKPGRKSKIVVTEDQQNGEDEDAMEGVEENDEVEQRKAPTMYRWVSSTRTDIPGSEPTMSINFSIPTSLIPFEGQTFQSIDITRSHAVPEKCSAPGCGKPHRYRLVKDWTKGACGIQCLKLLEAAA